MKPLRSLALMAIAAGFLLAPHDKAHAQVAVSIGAAPVCPYGYYEAPPYNCAPDGYYGSDHFYGHVDHHLDYRKGYHGAMPARGAAPAEHRVEFHGQAMHDVHGHEAPKHHK